jgi:hypothetical protein
MLYNHHQQKYTDFILKNADEEKWSKFVGRCLLFGVKLNLDIDNILKYVFENYHSLSLDEIPNINQIKDDIELYFKNRDEYCKTVSNHEIEFGTTFCKKCGEEFSPT